MSSAHGGQKDRSDALGLELWMAVGHHVDAGEPNPAAPHIHHVLLAPDLDLRPLSYREDSTLCNSRVITKRRLMRLVSSRPAWARL